MSSMPKNNPVTYNERFCADDAEVTIKSSDDVLFKVHRKNLAVHSEVFPDEGFITLDEVVELSERASTLELLFQYMYRQPQPDLTKVPFAELAPLAEAAEKYRVFSAMEICKVLMSAALPDHAIEILGYAVRHGYFQLCLQAVPHTLNVDAKDAFGHLGHAYFVNWVLYRDARTQVLLYAHQAPRPGDHMLHKGGVLECDLWKPFQTEMIADIGSDLGSLRRIDSIYLTNRHMISSCSPCIKRAATWTTQINGRVATLPSFSLDI